VSAVPQSPQKLSSGSYGAPHFGQASSTARERPQPTQNFRPSRFSRPHEAQTVTRWSLVRCEPGYKASAGGYSHSIVAGGFDVTSSTTRLTPGISFTIRAEIVSTRSYGSRAQSAVIASSLVTARITTG